MLYPSYMLQLVWAKIQIQAQSDKGQEEKNWGGAGSRIVFTIFFNNMASVKTKESEEHSYSNGIGLLIFCSVAKEMVK